MNIPCGVLFLPTATNTPKGAWWLSGSLHHWLWRLSVIWEIFAEEENISETAMFWPVEGPEE